jgi:uncharacterized protein
MGLDCPIGAAYTGCVKPRPLDPRHLDVAFAAREGATLRGEWPLAGFERLVEAGGEAGSMVAWSAVAGQPNRPGAPTRAGLHLVAQATVTRECQRCLQPMALALAVDRRFLFAADEATAAALDAETDETDVLVLAPRLDLHELVEDELLLALPIVPRHECCPEPLPMAAAADAPQADEAPPHPFAALAAWKRGH